MTRPDVTAAVVVDAIRRHGNPTRAAADLGVSRGTITNRLEGAHLTVDQVLLTPPAPITRQPARPEAARPAATVDWRHHAECLDEDPELFFPTGNTGLSLRQIQEAKAVCRTCDVAGDCLRWANETGQDFGIWGGLTEDERRAQKRRDARRRTSSATTPLTRAKTAWSPRIPEHSEDEEQSA